MYVCPSRLGNVYLRLKANLLVLKLMKRISNNMFSSKLAFGSTHQIQNRVVAQSKSADKRSWLTQHHISQNIHFHLEEQKNPLRKMVKKSRTNSIQPLHAINRYT